MAKNLLGKNVFIKPDGFEGLCINTLLSISGKANLPVFFPTKKAVIIFIMPAFLVFDGSIVNVFSVPFSSSKPDRDGIRVQKTERMFVKLFPRERRIVFIIILLLKRKRLDVYGEKF